MLLREEFHQVLLDLHGIGVPGEPEPQGEASHMGVHNDPLVDPEGVAEHDVGGLAARAGKSGEFPDGARDFAAVALRQRGTHAADRLGLVPVESRRAHDLLQFLLRDVRVVIGRAAAPEERLGHDVDPHVGALGGEDRGDEQFEGVREIELAVGVGIDERQFSREGRGAFLACHGWSEPEYPARKTAKSRESRAGEGIPAAPVGKNGSPLFEVGEDEASEGVPRRTNSATGEHMAVGDELEITGDVHSEFERGRQAPADRRVGEDEEAVRSCAPAPEGFHRLVTESLGHHYCETLTAGALRP